MRRNAILIIAVAILLLLAIGLGVWFGLIGPRRVVEIPPEVPPLVIAAEAPVVEAAAVGPEASTGALPIAAVAGREAAASSPDAAPSPEALADPGVVVAPEFEFVRAGEDGPWALAGIAEPGALIELMDGLAIVGEAEANERGEWMLVPEPPLQPGEQSLSVRTTTADRRFQTIARAEVTVPSPGLAIAALTPGQEASPGSPRAGRKDPRPEALSGEPETPPAGEAEPGPAVTPQPGAAAVDGSAPPPGPIREDPGSRLASPEPRVIGPSGGGSGIPADAPVADAGEPPAGELTPGNGGEPAGEAPVREPDLAAPSDAGRGEDRPGTPAQPRIAEVPSPNQPRDAPGIAAEPGDVANPAADAEVALLEPEAGSARGVREGGASLEPRRGSIPAASVPSRLPVGSSPPMGSPGPRDVPSVVIAPVGESLPGGSEPVAEGDAGEPDEFAVAEAPSLEPAPAPGSAVVEQPREGAIAVAPTVAAAAALDAREARGFGEATEAPSPPGREVPAVSTPGVAAPQVAPAPAPEEQVAVLDFDAVPPPVALRDEPPGPAMIGSGTPRQAQSIASGEAVPAPSRVARGSPPVVGGPSGLAARPDIRPEPGAAAVLTAPAEAEALPPLTVAAVEADPGRLVIAGTAAVDAPIRVYVDDRLVGEARPLVGERWIVDVPQNLAVGEHRIRLEQLGPDGLSIAEGEEVYERKIEVAELDLSLRVGAGADARAAGLVNDPRSLIVRRRDTLWDLSRRIYRRGIRFETLVEANRDQIPDPRLIYPGQIFVVPDGNAYWVDQTPEPRPRSGFPGPFDRP